MSRARRRIVINEVHIELEQIDAVPEDLFLDCIAMSGQKIHRTVELIEPKILGLRQPNPIKPALMAGEFGAWAIQPLRRHRQQSGFMWHFQLLLLNALLNGFANPELLPQCLGHMHNAEIETVLDLDIPNPSRGIKRYHLAAVIKNPSNALDQPFERCPVEPVRTPEAVHHFGFDIALLGMADILG